MTSHNADDAQEQLPGTAPLRVKVTDFAHIAALGQYVGLAEVVETLTKTPEQKRAPGYSLALAIIEKATAEARSDILQRNLRAAAKAGIDISQCDRISMEGDEIVASPHRYEDQSQ